MELSCKQAAHLHLFYRFHHNGQASCMVGVTFHPLRETQARYRNSIEEHFRATVLLSCSYNFSYV